MKPRRAPCSFSKRSLYRARSSLTALRSTSLNVVSIAAVDCAWISRSAIRARSRVIGTRRSPRSPAVSATGAGAAAMAGAAAGAAPLSARCVSTSPLVMRPARPDPAIAAGASLCSSTRRRTEGASLSTSFLTSPAPAGEVAEPSPGLRPTSPADAGEVADAREVATAAPSSITARICPPVTVAPFWTFSSLSTPVAGAGTSSTTLSVSRSTRFSSRLTASPGCLRHATSVASATDSGSCGTRTSIVLMTSSWCCQSRADGSWRARTVPA